MIGFVFGGARSSRIERHGSGTTPGTGARLRIGASMSKRHTILGFCMTMGVALTASLSGCSSDTGTSSGGSDVASEEAALNGAQDSLASAKEQAKACFETFRSCREASDADVRACRDALNACLPADAPKPPHCGGVRRQQEDQGPSDEAAAGSDGDADQGAHGRSCEKPPVDRGKLKSCGASAGAGVEQGTPVDDAMTTHADCMDRAFGDLFKRICDRAASHCNDSNAPADVCARIGGQCASLAASP